MDNNYDSLRFDAIVAETTEIAKTDNIMGFFNVMAHNINLSCLNLILLYTQLPDAQEVCGEMAWEQIGRKVVPEPQTAVLMCPEVDFTSDSTVTVTYNPVLVVDYASTTGRQLPPKPVPEDIIGAILLAANTSMEVVEPSFIKERGVGAEYNRDRCVFFLSNKWDTASRRTEAMLFAYIEYICGIQGVIDDSELRHAIRYVVFTYLGISSQSIKSIQGGIFMKLSKRPPQNIYDFFYLVRTIALKIIEDLTSPMLTFEETSLVNGILTNANQDWFLKKLDMVADEIDYLEWSEIASSLKEKIRASIGDTTLNLFIQKRKCDCIYTFPPYRLTTTVKQEPIINTLEES